MLSQLTPGDRAAIAGMTGYRLSPTGEIENPHLTPPWPVILEYAKDSTARPSRVDVSL